MSRRLSCSIALVVLVCGGLRAQTLSYSPLHPNDGDVVTFQISTFNCGASLNTDFAPPGPGNGSIRFTIRQGCICVATPSPITFTETVGPLPSGTYDVELYGQSLDGEVPCSPLQLLGRSTLAVADTALSLRQERFRVTADWSAPGFGQGKARGVPLTDESGYFTFFGPTNVELIVKLLNGCPVNQRYWVFIAGVTNVGVTVRVEDTETGQVETYTNPAGKTFATVLDTARFESCP